MQGEVADVLKYLSTTPRRCIVEWSYSFEIIDLAPDKCELSASRLVLSAVMVETSSAH
jgi:hypothetical protein